MLAAVAVLALLRLAPSIPVSSDATKSWFEAVGQTIIFAGAVLAGLGVIGSALAWMVRHPIKRIIRRLGATFKHYLQDVLAGRFGQIERSVDNIEQRVESIDKRVEHIDSRVEDIDERVVHIEDRVVDAFSIRPSTARTRADDKKKGT